MDIAKEKKGVLSEDYLLACQLTELMGDIENVATTLVNAAKKARKNCEKSKDRLRLKDNA